MRHHVPHGINLMNSPILPNPNTIFEITETGRQQLEGGATTLFADALRFLVLTDGKVSFGQIAKSLADVPEEILNRIVADLQQKGFIQPQKTAESAGGDDLSSLDFSSYIPPDPETVRKQRDEEFARRLEDAQNYMALMKAQGYAVRIARQAGTAAKPSSGGAYTVLIVEDHQELAESMQMFLELENFAPRVASNRDEIAMQLRTPPLPDVVLLDVTLPDTNGFEILQRMRGHPVLKAMPVIMVTAMTARDDVMRALGSDANGYITKPFQLDVLLKSIKAVLGLR